MIRKIKKIFVRSLAGFLILFIAVCVWFHFDNIRLREEEQKRTDAINQFQKKEAPFLKDFNDVFIIDEDNLPLDDSPYVAEKEKELAEDYNDLVKEGQYATSKDKGGDGTLAEIFKYSVKKAFENEMPEWLSGIIRFFRKL